MTTTALSLRRATALCALVAAALLLIPTALGSSAARVSERAASTKPETVQLTDRKLAHWTVVMKPAVARARPSGGSRAVAKLGTMTGDGTQNVVLVLTSTRLANGQIWYRVRLPILPNNSTGWVPAGYLGDLYQVRTHVYLHLSTMTLTLRRNDRPIFTTRVGVGKPYWPTPRGEFYVRDKLTNFNNPVYGPIAFGTSARSAVLTDWPGGGFVGIHGTNEPGILPGRVSHGCIRLRNEAIIKLEKLMPVGTPLTIS